MLTAYEHRLLALYLANAASRLSHRDPEATALSMWVTDRENLIARGREDRRSRRRRREIDRNEELSARQFRELGDALREECSNRRVQPDRTARRLRRLANSTGLSRIDLAILEALLRYRTRPVFESMIDDIFDHPLNGRLVFTLGGRTLPLLLGLSPNAVAGRLGAGAPLLRSGLVAIDRDDGEVTMLDRLSQLVHAPGSANRDVSSLLLDPALASDLDWTDFDHVADDRDHVETLIRGALDTRAPGVNILLYGPPGTGKTEFCKVLAERLGVTLYSVGEADEDGDEPSRRERLQELRLAQRLLTRERRALLVFDEMEDLLGNAAPDLGFLPRRRRGSRGAVSRVFMHRLLEQAPTPTLWTMNDTGHVSPAVLRRMMFAFEMRAPTVRVRTRIWVRQLERYRIPATPGDARALACEFDATPGVAAGAIAAARLGAGDLATVRRGVRSLSRVMGRHAPPQETPERFDLALVQADTDARELADRLVDSGERRFSLCLQGPPGTGKSAFVRYLAERLGLEVMQKRASDLMSMWVGGTEQQIVDAFAEARDDSAFLVFDEADSLLADRRFASRNWEVSQVNEMLTWMESHPLPFACTTNFGQHLDPATLRRFVFKVTLDYLTPAQATMAFRASFGLAPPEGVADLTALTPGDFAVVRRKARLLGCLAEPDALAAMLRAECAAKPHRPRAIGFLR
ncbi:MAG: AAA family ATPase [bacterium]|nr:AAA family ATPase [bacterium]